MEPQPGLGETGSRNSSNIRILCIFHISNILYIDIIPYIAETCLEMLADFIISPLPLEKELNSKVCENSDSSDLIQVSIPEPINFGVGRS